jgi:hypothetical protein
MELARVVKQNISIADEVEVLHYVYTGTAPIEVMARVALGSPARPLAGGGLYRARIRLNSVPLSPDSDVAVPPSCHETIIVSRPVPLEGGDVVSIRVIGLAADTAVDTVASLRDVTPAKMADLQGSGPIQVDHDYGGPDNLAVETSTGVRVDNASIRCFRYADYASGRRSQEFVVATVSTDVNGRWTSPMMLDVGDYSLLVFKQGVIRPRVVHLVVT